MSLDETDREDEGTAVLLRFQDGRKEFVPEAHVHGIRDGDLLLASGTPGAGLDAEVVRRVPLSDLTFVETCSGPEPDSGNEAKPTWTLSHGD